jgi:hypothetical protein
MREHVEMFGLPGDEVLTCIDCRSQFVFSVGEQKFYEQRQLDKPSGPTCMLFSRKHLTDISNVYTLEIGCHRRSCIRSGSRPRRLRG